MRIFAYEWGKFDDKFKLTFNDTITKEKLLFSIILLAGVSLSAGAKKVSKVNFVFNDGIETLSIDRSKVKKITFTEEHPAEQTFKVGEVEFKVLKVEKGTFTMGATAEQENPNDNEKPTHQVTLTKDYYIAETEVTQALYKAVMGSDNNPSYFKGDRLPVEHVSYNALTGADGFLAKLSEKTGKAFRLPTEAEWEFAARGGNKSNKTQYSGSATADDVAWHSGNADYKTHEVAQKNANELGLYDMSGNVWEWCSDWYGEYSSEAQTDPEGPESGSKRVFRGASIDHVAEHCRTSYRGSYDPDQGSSGLGLRLCLSAE